MSMWLAFLALASGFQADSRMTDVSESPDGFSCRAQTLPELSLAHDWRDGERRAQLQLSGRETAAGSGTLSASFKPDVGAPFGTASLLLGFQLDLDRVPLRADPVAAHLRIDGKPDATALVVDGNRKSVSVAVIERLRGDLADRLMRASIVEIDITDGAATPIGRFSWDVRPLRRAPQILQVVNWSCR